MVDQMDYFDDIQEESPCFIVPDSQGEVGATMQRCDPTINGSLKELVMLRQSPTQVRPTVTASPTRPAITTRDIIDGSRQPNNTTDQEMVKQDHRKTASSSDSSDQSCQSQAEKGEGVSSSSTEYPNSTSSDSSKEELDKTDGPKLYPVKTVLSNLSQEDLFPTLPQGNTFLTSTPTVNPGSVPVTLYDDNLQSRGNASKDETTGVLLTLSEVTSRSGEASSGDIIKVSETSSSEGLISPTITNVISIRPTSPSTETSENNFHILEGNRQGSMDMMEKTDMEKTDEEETKNRAVNPCREETSLPKWQNKCIQEESENVHVSSVSSSIGTTSENSTHSTDTTTQSSSQKAPSLHQWQSPQDGSNELFENGHTFSTSGNLQVYKLPHRFQIQNPKGLIQLPELSQDIFQTKKKGTSADSLNKNAELSPTDHEVIVLSSQENTFTLHLTQSQSNSPATTKMDCVDRESEPLSTRAHSFSPSQSILPQTSLAGSPPGEYNKTEEQNQDHPGPDISKDKGTDTLEKNENATAAAILSSRYELVPSPEVVLNRNEDKTNELLDERRDASPITMDDQMTESTESGQVPFHFSPPAVLLKPTFAMTPCFETSSESQKESLDEPSSPEICSTSEISPVVPEVLPKTLSLSVPVLCDESPDDSLEIEFNLQKVDFVPDTERRNKVIAKPARKSVFTNVQRFQVANEKRADVVDPFEFTDEVSGSPYKITGGKRKRRDVEERVEKRGKRTDISEYIELVNSTDRAKRKFWKIVKTRTITTTTTMIERELLIKYIDNDGNVLCRETTHEFDEPTYSTRAVESEETKEEVEDIPPRKLSSTNNKENTGSSRNQSSGDTTTGEHVNNEDRHKDTRSLSAGRQRSGCKSPGVCSKSDQNLGEGSRVLALWFDRHYYPGTLRSKNVGDSRCRIEFDDGDLRDIQERDILVVDYLPRDQPIMVREQHGDCYDNGVVQGFYRTRHERGYKVAKGDGKVQNCPRSRVILNAEQAAIFLSLRSSLNTNDESLTDESELINSPISSESFTIPDQRNDVRSSSRTRSADRASNSKTSCNKAPSTSRTSRDNTAKTSTTSDKAANTSRTSPDKNTKQKSVRTHSTSETPKSRHKSTSQKLAKKGQTRGENCVNEDEGRPVGKVRRRLSCAMQMTVDKQRAVPTRTSPRKSGTHAQVDDDNLILPTDCDLFRGYGFVITGSDVNSVSYVDDDSPKEEDSTFSRNQVRRQIEAGGGIILPTFHEDAGDNVSYLLLSNSCQTTAKYFHALVVGVSCLSHVWLRDCCIENRLIDYKNYLLPAGKDLVTGKLVEQGCTNALMGLKVYLVGDNDFVKNWTIVLGAAQCEIVDKLPTNVLKELQYGNQDFFRCDVMVVGSGVISHSTIRKARLLAVPTVTIHWVKQCILTSKRVSFDAHPDFRHTVN